MASITVGLLGLPLLLLLVPAVVVVVFLFCCSRSLSPSSLLLSLKSSLAL